MRGPCLRCPFGFRKTAQRIGVRVKEMKIEVRLTMRVVIAKGFRIFPTRLHIIVRGSMTTTLVPAEAKTEIAISLVPLEAASHGSSVFSIQEETFSRTTIELETRMPTERPIASRVTTFSVCPAICMKKKLMMIVRGIEMKTIRVVRKSARKKKRMIAQRMMPLMMSLIVESTISWIVPASSVTTWRCMPPGRSSCISSTRLRHSSTSLTVFASPFLTIERITHSSPLSQARRRTSSVVMKTVPRSPRVLRTPSLLTTSKEEISSISGYSASNLTLTSVPFSRMYPDGSELMFALIAPTTSAVVSPAATNARRSSSTWTSRPLPPMISTLPTPGIIANLSARELST